jgi:hypothetical protein
MTKERMKDLLIVGMLPFLIVAFATTDWSFLYASSKERQCDIVHENLPHEYRCEMFDVPG